VLPFYIATALLLCALIVAAAVAVLVRKRNAHIWLPAYLGDASRRRADATARERHLAEGGKIDVMFALVDHFEPVVKPGQNPEAKAGAMDAWLNLYPKLAAKHRDSDSRPPRHTFTFPIETYSPEMLDSLVGLCRQDLGEVEVHIHHDGDTSDSFRTMMTEGLESFARHGVNVVRDVDGHRFGFVHGNWTLDNSRPDGRWCGVNDELIILRELGCFVDVTLPSAPSPTQTRACNAIYYATDDPERPKSHNTGEPVRVGGEPSGDLMILQGPLGPDWTSRKLGLIPRIDNGDITGANPARLGRIDRWVDLGIGVLGRPEWIFVKVYCHGALARDRDALLGDGADRMHDYIESHYGEGSYRLHYVSVREMYNIVKAAEAGRTGNAGDFRDFEIPPYECFRDAPTDAP
jgi:hypothetical protein